MPTTHSEDSVTTFETLLPDAGFLTDRQILIALEANHLIDKGTWEPGQVRHASYTLRLGDEVRVARAIASAGATSKEFTIVRLNSADASVELRPGDTALLYSEEHVRLPDTILAFTVARGLLYAEALAPENTYVDPGFAGALYTTVTNISNRVVFLQRGLPVARLFFFRLSEKVSSPYRAGSGMGIGQQLSSIRAVAVGSVEECERASDSQLRESIGQMPLGGAHLSVSLSRLSTKLKTAELRLYTIALTWPVLLLFANNNPWFRTNVGPFIGNIAAGLVAAALLFGMPRLVKYFNE
jgi:deoxycytidine triphosphate deaminase